MNKKILTLALVVSENKILLGLKKRGFGEGQWNGFGGKVEVGESVQEAAVRELEEEAGIVPLSMEEQGVLNFTFESESFELEVHVFRVTAYRGEVKETEEMCPQWFNFESVPYDAMWPDDSHWLPLLIEGKRFVGRFHFDRPSTGEYRSKILNCSVDQLV